MSSSSGQKSPIEVSVFIGPRHSTTLSPAQEAIVVELRRLLLLPLDDLLVITREFVNAQASRSALDRCLRRHGVNNLRELQAAASGESGRLH